MGQKVNPIGLRLGINRNWIQMVPFFSKMPANVAEDDKIRKFVKKELYYAGTLLSLKEQRKKLELLSLLLDQVSSLVKKVQT